jgi:hypothetical protein
MIYLFGDSHARFSFKNMNLEHKDLHTSGVTMFRIGRDNQIPLINNIHINVSDIIVFVYGEVDCRCHIHR